MLVFGFTMKNLRTVRLGFVLLYFVCWFGTIQAQQQFMLSLNERAFEVIPTADKGFYTLTHQVNCPNDHVVVRYFSRSGVLQSEVRSPVYLGNINHITALTLSNTHLILYMRSESIDHLVYEFDSTGAMLWNRNFQLTQPVVAFKKLLPIPDGGFYLLGNYDINSINDSAKAVLVRFNSLGVVQWMKQYSMSNVAKSYVKLNDLQWVQGQLLAAGYHYRSGNVVGWAPKRPTWVTLDTAGNPLVANYYMVDSSMIGFDEYEFMRLEPTPAGQYQALVYNSGNEHALMRLDAQLNIRWIRERLAGRVKAFCVGYNDEVYVVPDGPTANMVLGMDSNGAFLSARQTAYSSAFNDNSLYGVVMDIKRYDCGFLLANDKSLLAHNPKSMAYCADSVFTYNPLYHSVTVHTRKTVNLSVAPLGPYNVYTSNGVYTPQNNPVQTWCSSAYSCSGTTGVGDIGNSEGVRVYPSLYRDIYTIELPDSEPWQLDVFTMLGQRLESRELKGYLRYTIDGRYSANGQYLLRLQSGSRVFRTRIECLR